jgi:long-chain acyl-CoA synthetase
MAPDGDDYAAWRASGAGGAPLLVARPGDAFNIIYSSGTTGMPKGIVHLHGMRQRQAQRNGFGFSMHSRTLLSTPMYSNTTITPMIGSLANGGECILMRKFDAGRYLALAARCAPPTPCWCRCSTSACWPTLISTAAICPPLS